MRSLSRLFFPHLSLRMAEDTGGGSGEAGGTKASDTETKAATDVQAEIQKALAAQAAEFTAKLKTATGHESFDAIAEAEARRKGETDQLLEQRNAELREARAQLDRERTSSAILAAAGEAVDPAIVLALLADQAKVQNGAVVIDGLPAAEAVKKLLAEKPFLAKAAGAGSGAPQSSGVGAEPNPWKTENLNLTRQGEIARTDPAKARQFMAAAGIRLT